MGVGLLPWERLPAWLLGPLMVAGGVFLLFYAEPYSWRQFEAGSFAVVGVIVFICGVKKRRTKTMADATTDKN